MRIRPHPQINKRSRAGLLPLGGHHCAATDGGKAGSPDDASLIRCATYAVLCVVCCVVCVSAACCVVCGVCCVL